MDLCKIVKGFIKITGKFWHRTEPEVEIKSHADRITNLWCPFSIRVHLILPWSQPDGVISSVPHLSQVSSRSPEAHVPTPTGGDLAVNQPRLSCVGIVLSSLQYFNHFKIFPVESLPHLVKPPLLFVIKTCFSFAALVYWVFT